MKKQNSKKKKSTTKRTNRRNESVSANPYAPPCLSGKDLQECLDMVVESYPDSPDMAIFDGYDDCLLYFQEDEAGNPHAVYCYEDLIESFARKNHTTYTEAVEWVDYNVIRSIPYMTHVGDKITSPPYIIYRINKCFTSLDPSYYAKTYSDDPD